MSVRSLHIRAALHCVLAASMLGASCHAVTVLDGETSSDIVSAGITRTFTVHVPNGHSAATRHPVLIAFHGAGGSGAGMQSLSGLDAWADRLGFIAVYPDAAPIARRNWALGCAGCTSGDAAGVDDYRFVRDLVDRLDGRYSIDRRRVYVAGFSLGGSLAYDATCRETDLIAGAAIVASLPSLEELPLCRAPTRPVRIITVVGEIDSNVPWAGGAGGSGATYRDAASTALDWSRRNGCVGPPIARDLPDRAGTGSYTRVLEYAACPDSTFVRFFHVAATGHAWPASDDFDVSAELARSFFGAPASER